MKRYGHYGGQRGHQGTILLISDINTITSATSQAVDGGAASGNNA